MAIAFRKLCCCFGDDGLMDDADLVSHYSGEKNCFGQRHGYGTCMLANGDIYEGCWKYDAMEGFGKYIFASGEIREGFFKDGQYVAKTFTGSGYHADPFAQTAKEDEEQKQREIERKRKLAETARLREEGKKRREEFWEKYGSIQSNKKVTKRKR